MLGALVGVTLLKSTLLLSLLTPAFEGLRSMPLLPSRLVGTELGDTIEPGGVGDGGEGWVRGESGRGNMQVQDVPHDSFLFGASVQVNLAFGAPLLWYPNNQSIKDQFRR